MHDQFRSLLRANTGLSAAVHYSRARPPLNVLPLFDSLGDAEVEQLMKHCISQAQSQVSSALCTCQLRWLNPAPASIGCAQQCAVRVCL